MLSQEEYKTHHLQIMASDPQSLAALEALMNEFFAASTSNARKREIEEMLNNFSLQQGAWKHCLYFLSNTSNQYVSMYCLTTIEKLITRQWLGVPWEERVQLKAALYQITVDDLYNTAPNFIRNKLVKLVVDVARLDWPHFYPDFFTNILQLVQSKDKSVLGLMFLLTASEELVFPWEDLSVARKEELKRLLLNHVPEVFSLLTGILEAALQKHRQSVTATPPPSPTHGQPSSVSPVNTGSLLSSMLDNAKNSSTGNSSAISDTDNDVICSLSLKVLTHMFMWVPINSTITPDLISIIFRLASSSMDSSRDDGDSIRTLAMAAINEILYRKCAPPSFEDFVLNLLHLAVSLLQNWLAKPIGTEPPDSYEEKLIEFLNLFVGLHIPRIEENPRFPVVELINCLFQFTFHSNNLEHLSKCLEVWDVFLTHLKSKKVSTHTYDDILLNLMKQILVKSMFRHNQAQLEELDDETLNDDNQTEWQSFLCDCIDIIDKIISLIPDTAFMYVYSTWEEFLQFYVKLEETLSPAGEGQVRKCAITRDSDLQHVHCTLRDLSTYSQIIGRLSAHHAGDDMHLAHGKEIVPRLCNMVVFCCKVQYHRLQVSFPQITVDFVEVHSQILAALQAWSTWLAQLQRESRQACQILVAQICNSIVPILVTEEEPTKLCHASAHLLATLITVVRPPELWELECVRNLYNVVSTLRLPLETSRIIQRCLCGIALLPWPSTNEQMWDQRQKLLTALLEPYVARFRILSRSTFVPEQEASPIISQTLRILEDAIEVTKDENSASRKLLFSVIQGSVQQTLAVFPQYVQSSEICECVFNFFLTAFSGLTQQLGASFTEQTVQTFLNVFTRDHVRTSLGQEGGAGTRVVEKFLLLLQLVMKEPGTAFKGFVSNTIIFCLQHVYPLVCESASPDIKLPLFSVLHAILLYRWQYFYRITVLQSLEGIDSIENKDQLVAILQAYGHSLLHPDINVFTHNLRSLEQINTKWKLYQKSVFREQLLSSFLTVLLQTLLHKSHALLGDDIVVAIYNMAAVDFSTFQYEFIPHFLHTTGGLDASQKTILQKNFKDDIDLPSFTQNILRFINDMRCYHLCNASLPEGTITL